MKELIMTSIIEHELYLHGDSDSLYQEGLEMGMSETSADNFAHAAYELMLTLTVNIETGDAILTHVENVKLETPINI